MANIFKSIIIANQQDCSIIKHHIQELDLMFECSIDDNVIHFFDKHLYTTIKEFMNRTKIKSKIYKTKEQ